MNRYSRRRTIAKANSIHAPITGALRRCFVCGHVNTYDRMRRLARRIWSCPDEHRGRKA